MKILYVEDEPFLAKIVQETLEGQNFNVELITDGALAVDHFVQGDFDICVLDIMLPHMNGYDIAKEIRKLAPEIPILFLTAKDKTEDVVMGFKSGGNDYLRKPFSIEELIVRIRNLVKLTQSSSNAISKEGIRLGHIYRFFPKRSELINNELSKKLSYKENQILVFLCKNLNETVHRQKILMSVWGDDSFFNSRTLDVYISKLRAYLKSDPNIEILTLKGVGYRFLVKE